jgi:hypothetical protein
LSKDKTASQRDEMPRWQCKIETRLRNLRGFQVHGRLLAPSICFDFVAQTLILMERYHSRTLYGRNMDKTVRTAVLGGEEAVPLVRIKEFYGADRHGRSLHENRESTRGIAGEADSASKETTPK